MLQDSRRRHRAGREMAIEGDELGRMRDRPTVFIGVPRVFDRIYAGVTGQVKAAGGLKAFLFNYGYSRKLAALNRGVEYPKV